MQIKRIDHPVWPVDVWFDFPSLKFFKKVDEHLQPLLLHESEEWRLIVLQSTDKMKRTCSFS